MQFESFHTVSLSLRRLGLAALFVAPAMGLLTGSALSDTPPIISVEAKSSPATVPARTAVLSVLGADDLGESKLIYTWSTVGTPPAVPTYSSNGKNAAKTVTVTFKAAGSYEFKAVIKDLVNTQTVTSSVPVTVLQTPTFSLSPTSLRCNAGSSKTFTVSLKDQFSKLMPLPGPVSYSVTGGGTISTNGVFKAGNIPGGPYTLTAVSGSLTATASIVVNAGPTIATPASVSVNPVTGTNCIASVLGADDAGTSALSYSWSATGPTTVSFSPNNSPSAKSTKVIFKKTGTYLLKATVKDAQGLTAQSSVSVNVVATPIRVVVSPATVALDPLTTAQFTANAYNQFNAPMTNPPPAVTWSAQGVSINASGLATADGDAGVSYTVLATAGSVFGSAILQINNVAAALPPVITPAGGTFDQPQTVTITPATFTPMTTTPGWRTGVKFPGQEFESVEAISQDGTTVAAMRASTMARIVYMFPGASMSPDSGPFPFYIWSLADLSGTYMPAMFAGFTEDTDWDGNNYDLYYGERGNRVLMLMTQRWDGSGGDISLWSCAAGINQAATNTQNLANYARMPVSTFAGQAIRFDFAGDKVRLVVGATPLVSATTDADGWVTYTGDAASGRVTAQLGATRFWISLAGGDPVGTRELVISDKPKTTTRFTFDGSAVTEASPAVTNALTLTHDTKLRARVYSAVAYRSPETVGVFTSTIPLLPAESYISPAYIPIAHATLDGTPAQVSLDGPSGNISGLSIGDFRYLMRYPLLPDAPTPLTLHRNNLADLSGNVLWRSLEIGTVPDADVRLGESLILTAGSGQTGMLQITILDSTNGLYSICTGSAGDAFPTLFSKAGTFNIVATLDGISIGSLVVTVTQVDLQGPIACQIGYKRVKEVLIYGPTNGVFFTANDPTLLQVSVKEATPRGVRLYLKAMKAGTPILQARLGSKTGPILAQQEVDEFTLKSQATKLISVLATFPDGAKLLQTYLEMDPQVLNLGVKLHIIIRGVTFEDSTLDMALNTNNFTYDAVTGKYRYTYRLISTPDLFTGTCHTIAVYQGSDKVGQ